MCSTYNRQSKKKNWNENETNEWKCVISEYCDLICYYIKKKNQIEIAKKRNSKNTDQVYSLS